MIRHACCSPRSFMGSSSVSCTKLSMSLTPLQTKSYPWPSSSLELSFHSFKGKGWEAESESVPVPVMSESTSPFCVSDLKFSEWFSSDSILVNFNTIIQSVTSPESYTSGPLINRVPSDTFGPSVEEMEVDLQSNPGDHEEDDDEDENVEDNEEFMSADEDFEGDEDTDSIQMSIEAGPSTQSLPSINVPLAILPPLAPSPSTVSQLSPSTVSQLSPSALALVPSQREIALMNAQHHYHQAVSASPPVSLTSSALTSSHHPSTLGPPALPGPSTSPIIGTGVTDPASLAMRVRSTRRTRVAAAGRAITAAPNVPSSSSLRIPPPSNVVDRTIITAARSAPASAGLDFHMDHDSQLGDLMKALPSSSSTTSLTHSSTFVNESILSLLLRLHSKLSRKKDSYRYVDTSGTESRIGDGAHFIGNLLDTYVRLSPINGLKAINEWRERIWPPEYPEPSCSQRSCSSLGTTTTDSVSGSSDTSLTEAELKKKRAKERQQRLMAEFASKQKAFMKKYQQSEKLMSTEASEQTPDVHIQVPQCQPSKSSAEESEASKEGLNTDESRRMKVEEYECVICNQTTASTPEKLIGMVVLLQSTSVLGHSIPIKDMKGGSFKDVSKLEECLSLNALTCNEEEERWLRQVHEESSLGKLMRMRFETLDRTFSNLSWLNSISIGWEGGIHVASCGHYLHLDCHKSYMTSLKNTSTMNSSTRQGLENGEFSCPLCRQLANSVLPIIPDSIGLVSKHPVSDQSSKVKNTHGKDDGNERLCHEVLSFLHEASLEPSGQSLIKLLGSFMEDLTRATSPQHRSLPTTVNPTTQSLFLFLCSIIRTNVEIDAINKLVTKNVPTGTKKPSFKSLFNVLALNAKVFITTPYSFLWTSLTGSTGDDEMSLLLSGEQDVPLLLKDPSATLIQLLVSLPLNLEITYFSQLTSILLNLTIVQSLVTISCYLGDEARRRFKNTYLQQRSNPGFDLTSSLPSLLGFIILQLDPTSLYLSLPEDEKMKVIGF